MMPREISCLFLSALICCLIGCNPTVDTSSDLRVNKLRSEFQSIGKNLTDKQIHDLISATEAQYGDATIDEKGYPLYELRPWEKPDEVWSWNKKDKKYDVAPSRIVSSYVKTAPDVEHRCVEIIYPKTSDPTEVAAAAIEVWKHFAAEVNRRHPQANFKRVQVLMWVDGQNETAPAGIVSNEASFTFPDQPDVEWQEWVESPLRFSK